MDNALHFTQCELLFFTSIIMICKTNTSVQLALAYVHNNFNAHMPWLATAKLLTLSTSYRDAIHTLEMLPTLQLS